MGETLTPSVRLPGANRAGCPDRAQSEVLGVVLIIGVTIAVASTVVVVGSFALTDSREVSEVGSAEHAMTQLDSTISLVGHGDADRRQTRLPVAEDATVFLDEGAGLMRVEVRDVNGTVGDELMNESLGAVVYRQGDTTVAYQGGGVWKRSTGGSTMVSPPEFHYRGTTLTLPLVVVRGETSPDGRLDVTKGGDDTHVYPVHGDENRSNPLTDARVAVVVQSEYYQAWGRFFEERTGGSVAYDDPNETVTVELVTPDERPPVESAISSTSSEEMVIEGAGGDSFTDSYDSASGPYVDTKSSSGVIRTVGGVDVGGGARIEGDLVTGGGTVRIRGGSTLVTGYLAYGGSAPDCTGPGACSQVQGWVAGNGSVSPIDPVDAIIASRHAFASESEDPLAADFFEVSPELGAGTYYYVGDLVLGEDDNVTFDLSDGPISLVVDGTISLNGATIDVVNATDQNDVRIYMTGSRFEMQNGATVEIPGDESPRFWVYGPSNTDVELRNDGTVFRGVIYAPDSESRSGTVLLTAQAEVYGGIVAGQMTIRSGASVHYDEALRDAEPILEGEIPRVTFLHVSVHPVEVGGR